MADNNDRNDDQNSAPIAWAPTSSDSGDDSGDDNVVLNDTSKAQGGAADDGANAPPVADTMAGDGNVLPTPSTPVQTATGPDRGWGAPGTSTSLNDGQPAVVGYDGYPSAIPPAELPTNTPSATTAPQTSGAAPFDSSVLRGQVQSIAQAYGETWDADKVDRIVGEIQSGQRTLRDIDSDVSLRVGRGEHQSRAAEATPSADSGAPVGDSTTPGETVNSTASARDTARQQVQSIAQAYGETWDADKVERLTNEVLSGTGRSLGDIDRDVSARRGREAAERVAPTEPPVPAAAPPAPSTPTPEPTPNHEYNSRKPQPGNGPAGFGQVGSYVEVNGKPGFIDYDGYPSVRVPGQEDYIAQLRRQGIVEERNPGNAKMGGTKGSSDNNDALISFNSGGKTEKITQQELQNRFNKGGFNIGL